MTSFRFFSIILLLTLLRISNSFAQDLTSMIESLSSSCQTSAAGLMTTDFGTCSNINDFLPILGASGSITVPFSTWVANSCPMAPCSNSTLAAALSTVKTGCSSDITKGVPLAISLTSIITNYLPIRQMACAQYVSNSSFCATTLFTNIEKADNKNVTISLLESILLNGFPALIPLLAAAPKEDYCNDCGKELYILTSSIQAVGNSSSQSTSGSSGTSKLVASICGPSFVNGTPPSTVQQAASNNTANLSTTSALPGASNNAGFQFKPAAILLISMVLFSSMSLFA